MSTTLTLSGWGQPHYALSVLAADATHVDFARHASVPAALLDICAHHKQPDLVIGWSLGGQMAVRAIASGMLKPRQLVLIAAPYQFVKTAENPVGMPQDLFAKFRHNYHRNPELTLTKAWELVVKDDRNAEHVRSHIARQDKKNTLAKDWLGWLDHLETFSCDGLHLADFPPTLIIHGDRDVVVYPDQSERFVHAIPHAKHLIMHGCGHAPHWHDENAVRKAIYGG